MPKTVETYRTTKALRELVRRAAKAVDKRPSEFLRQAAEEKARAVLREAASEDLRRALARLPPGRAASDAEAERLGADVAQAARKGGA
jgi:DNA-directed RNA polymerase specialized sigma24 family protein